MDPEFWRARWRAGEIGFHQSEASWALAEHGHRLELARGTRVLVPMSGKSLDLAFLAGKGADVTGVELVEDAVRAFYDERGWAPERSVEGAHVRYSAGGVTCWAGDFFTFKSEPFPAIFDRAALVALPPELRPRYVAHVRRLLAPGGRILLVSFDYDQSKRGGPPFAVPPDEVRRSFDGLPIELLETRDALPSSPRFRQSGLERLDETAWLIGGPGPFPR